MLPCLVYIRHACYKRSLYNHKADALSYLYIGFIQTESNAIHVESLITKPTTQACHVKNSNFNDHLSETKRMNIMHNLVSIKTAFSVKRKTISVELTITAFFEQKR